MLEILKTAIRLTSALAIHGRRVHQHQLSGMKIECRRTNRRSQCLQGLPDVRFKGVRRAGPEVNHGLGTKPAQVIRTDLEIDVFEALAGNIALFQLGDQVVIDLVG